MCVKEFDTRKSSCMQYLLQGVGKPVCSVHVQCVAMGMLLLRVGTYCCTVTRITTRAERLSTKLHWSRSSVQMIWLQTLLLHSFLALYKKKKRLGLLHTTHCLYIYRFLFNWLFIPLKSLHQDYFMCPLHFFSRNNATIPNSNIWFPPEAVETLTHLITSYFSLWLHFPECIVIPLDNTAERTIMTVSKVSESDL